MLTHDRKGVSYPRWSPSGDMLAFLASDVNNKGQIFLMPMTGGDSMQLTKVSTGVQQFAWSPDGKSIAFAASEEAPKKTGPDRFDDAFEVGNNDFLVNAKPLPTHLWLMSAAGGDARRLTSGNWTLPISHPPSSPASPITWSPDSRSIAFVKIPTPYSGDADQSTLQLLDIASSTFKPVTGRTKQEAYPSFSPDGAHLAYWYHAMDIRRMEPIFRSSTVCKEKAQMSRAPSTGICNVPSGCPTASHFWLAQTMAPR